MISHIEVTRNVFSENSDYQGKEITRDTSIKEGPRYDTRIFQVMQIYARDVMTYYKFALN
jgi:hypothetical protein